MEQELVRAVMEDETSRKTIEAHKALLRKLVSEQQETLRVRKCHVNQGSLLSLISDRLGGSTDLDTGNLAEFSVANHGFSEQMFLDSDVLGLIQDASDTEGEDSPEKPQDSSESIEISPGVSCAFRGAPETWRAIKKGSTVECICSSCEAKIHCIEDAALIVCPMCWMVGPVEQAIGDLPLECDGVSKNHGLGLGVIATEVMDWVEAK